MSACHAWIRTICEKYKQGRHEEMHAYMKLLHANLMDLSQLANKQLLSGYRTDLDPLHQLAKQKMLQGRDLSRLASGSFLRKGSSGSSPGRKTD